MRMLLILEEIARVGVPVTPTEVNARIGLTKPTIHRLFNQLEEDGFLQRDIDGRSFIPGPRLRKLSTSVLSSLRVQTARRAVLGKLAETIGETCNVSLPDGDAMLYLDRVETSWPLRIQLPRGTRVPLHCTASGKLYLSTLSETHFERYLGAADLERRTEATITDPDRLREEIALTRERGYSQDAEEFMENMIAIAVPIHDAEGRLVSTLSFHAPTLRLSIDDAQKHVDSLNSSARELEKLLLD